MTNTTTAYYIDYIIESKVNGGIERTYYQLVRRADDAILAAYQELEYIFAECFRLGIAKDNVVIL